MIFQAEFNVISYSDQMRLRTAVELIKATHDIESQLDKVFLLYLTFPSRFLLLEYFPQAYFLTELARYCICRRKEESL